MHMPITASTRNGLFPACSRHRRVGGIAYIVATFEPTGWVVVMDRAWDADPTTGFKRRLGKSPEELGVTHETADCPDIWELDNGDIAVIGRDLTDSLGRNLPAGVSISPDERLVVIPRKMIIAAKPDIPNV